MSWWSKNVTDRVSDARKTVTGEKKAEKEAKKAAEAQAALDRQGAANAAGQQALGAGFQSLELQGSTAGRQKKRQATVLAGETYEQPKRTVLGG